MPLSDNDLLVRVLATDDRHAFGELVRRHQSDVRGLLRRLTGGDAARADDLAQETFLRAYRSLASYRGSAQFSSWLYRIAYNAFLSDARRRTEELMPADQPEQPPEGPMPDRSMMRHDLDKAMTMLRPEERAALALTFGQGLAHDEAAAVLECPVGTLKSLVNRGKARLKELLEGAPA